MAKIFNDQSSKWFIDVELGETLSKEQTKEYFHKYRNGDLEAREILMIHNIRLVIFEVRTHFGSTSYDKQELVSVGLIGLIKAIDTFNLDKNIEFITYASRCIDNEIKMYMRKNKKYLAFESLDNVLDEESGYKIEDRIFDINSDFVSLFEDLELKENIIKIINTLDKRDSEIIKLAFGFYGKQYNQKDIATLYNLSQSYVSRIITKNVKKIFDCLYEQKLIEDNKIKIKSDQ